MKRLLLGSVLSLIVGTAHAATLAVTPGSGATILGHVDGSSDFYPSTSACDPTTSSQCLAINSSGQAAIQAPPSLPLPTGASTSGNQSSQITQETATAGALGTTADSAYAGSGSASVVSALKGIYTAARSPIAAGTNLIGSVSQSGTWTVQPGNTANTTAWLVTGTGGTFPATESGTWNITNISGTVSLPTGAATAANQTAVRGSIGSSFPTSAAAAGVESSGNVVGLIQADTSVAIAISTATTTRLIVLVSGEKIYVSELNIIAAGTGNIQFEYGTGSTCGTGTTPLTGNYNLTAQSGLAMGNGLGPVLVIPAGNSLCAITSAAVGMAGSVAYTQF